MATSNLQDSGFRFYLQNGVFAWAHPNGGHVGPNAVDCTDLSDAEFAVLVAATDEANEQRFQAGL